MVYFEHYIGLHRNRTRVCFQRSYAGSSDSVSVFVERCSQSSISRYALLMTANKPETALNRAPTFSLLRHMVELHSYSLCTVCVV